jgi:uncharacterized protein YndB with AHSA1/START domain
MSTKVEGREEETREIRKSIVIDASPGVVFKAIADPNELTKWFPDQVILEPSIGGKVRFSSLKETHPLEKLDMDYFMEGTIKELVPDKKLSYTWKFKNIPRFPETTVIWELEKIDPNKTKVKLTHLGFTGEEKGMTSLESHDKGWTDALNKLTKYCKGRE